MPKAQRVRSIRFYLVGALLVGAAAVTVIYLHLARQNDIAAIREARGAAIERGPRVEVVRAELGPKIRRVTLLADVRSYATATLYAKVSGYLKIVNVDKGDRVEAAQVVAEIESPELDQQYASALADMENKKRNFERARDLYARGVATLIAVQQTETDARVAESNVAALATMKNYQTIRAPFGGRVTSRFVDPGALITNAQNNQSSSQPVITVSDDSRLRIYAYLQQQDVPFVKVGATAEVADASNPDRKRPAEIARMTGELDARTRTMLIEFNIDNQDQFLVSGSFAYVYLDIPIESYPQIPVGGLIVRGDDTMVALLDKDIVRFKPVRVAVTDGTMVSLSDGLQPGDIVAINLPDEITNGSRVQVAQSMRPP